MKSSPGPLHCCIDAAVVVVDDDDDDDVNIDVYDDNDHHHHIINDDNDPNYQSLPGSGWSMVSAADDTTGEVGVVVLALLNIDSGGRLPATSEREYDIRRIEFSCM